MAIGPPLKALKIHLVVTALVYYEQTTNVYEAIAREKQIKKWRREKKNNLVKTMNPDWKDLSDEWNIDFSLRSK